MALYRAEKSRFNDSWSIEREYACINGLSCWFQVAVVNEADEAEMGYTDGEFGSAQERAEKIIKALNATAVTPCPAAHFHPGKTYLTQGGQAMRIERWSGADGRYATEQSRRPVWYREDGKCDVREWSHYDLLPGALDEVEQEVPDASEVDPGLCEGGEPITSEPCELCGATMDDLCRYGRL